MLKGFSLVLSLVMSAYTYGAATSRPATRPAWSPAEIARYKELQTTVAACQREIAACRKRINGMKGGYPMLGEGAAISANQKTIREQDSRIAESQAEMLLIRQHKWTPAAAVKPAKIEPLSAGMKVGDVGTLSNVKVRQVIDAGNMLGDAVFLVRHDGYDSRGLRHTDFENREVPCWLETSTAGLVDGQMIQPAHVFQVAGTKQYPTASGAMRTVFLLKPSTRPAK